MYKQRFVQGLLASAVILTLGGAAAARSDVFQATAASIDVVPVNLAGGCAQAYAFNVRLGAQAPGTLSYKIVTEDGRESQVFAAKAQATEDGHFAAQASHKLALAESEENAADPMIVVFEAPPALAPPREPGFFERLFGTGPAAQEDDRQGLRDLAFMVKIVAPNEVASAFDSHSVTCERQREARALPAAAEAQRDDDRGDRGRDDSGRDGGRGGSGGSAGGPAGTP